MKKAELRDRIEALEEALAVTQNLVAEQATERGRPRLDDPIYTMVLGPVTGYRVPDPADTAKVGDPDPTTSSDGGCPKTDSGWWCTRSGRHLGQHLAGDGTKVCHVWPNEADADPLPDGGTHTCPRCSSYVEALPPRRICDECETEVGTRRRWEVGDILEGRDAAAELPDGTTLLHVNDLDEPYDDAILRTLGRPLFGAAPNRGVWLEMRYRIESLPDVDQPPTPVVAPGQRDQTAAIEGAATTLRAHKKSVTHSGCICGWERESTDHARHVAEQLAAVGALGDAEPVAARPVLVDTEGDEWWPTIGGQYVLHPKGEKDIHHRPEIEVEYGPVIERWVES